MYVPAGRKPDVIMSICSAIISSQLPEIEISELIIFLFVMLGVELPEEINKYPLSWLLNGKFSYPPSIIP